MTKPDECCSVPSDREGHSSRYVCPVNGHEYREVSVKTILNHIRQPWNWQAKSQSYYFCDDPDCDVVYFGRDDSIIEKSALRTRVGVKESLDDAMLCYCFGVTATEAATQPEIKVFVAEQTRARTCECEARNPSGKCCLKDFPRH